MTVQQQAAVQELRDMHNITMATLHEEHARTMRGVIIIDQLTQNDMKRRHTLSLSARRPQESSRAAEDAPGGGLREAQAFSTGRHCRFSPNFIDTLGQQGRLF